MVSTNKYWVRFPISSLKSNQMENNTIYIATAHGAFASCTVETLEETLWATAQDGFCVSAIIFRGENILFKEDAHCPKEWRTLTQQLRYFGILISWKMKPSYVTPYQWVSDILEKKGFSQPFLNYCSEWGQHEWDSADAPLQFDAVIRYTEKNFPEGA